MPHGTFPIPPLPMRRTHSTFSTLLPQIYTVFPVAPRPASKYAILGASLQPPDNQPFTFRRPRATFSARPSPPRNAIFRPSIPALSKLHPLPFAPRSLSPRNPIHAQRPIPPLPSPIQNAKKGPSTTLFRPKAQHTFYTKISYCRVLNMKHRITMRGCVCYPLSVNR